jgi:hypothetical protein
VLQVLNKRQWFMNLEDFYLKYQTLDKRLDFNISVTVLVNETTPEDVRVRSKRAVDECT